MPPRPRPKPRPRAAASQPAGENETVTGPNAVNRSGVTAADDEDSFFIKRKITWDEIDRIQQRDRETEKKTANEGNEASFASDGDDDVRGVETLKSNYVSSIKPLPSWTRSLKDATSQKVVVIDIESSDSDDESLADKHGTKAKDLDTSPRPLNRKDRGQRSRSRSITPPPALSQTDVHAVTRQTSYQSSDISNSIPIVSLDDEDEDDRDFLDPELQMLKASVRHQSVRAESAEPSHLTDSEEENENAANQVVLLVTWVHNPEDNTPIVIDREMEFPYPRHRSFQKLFETLSDILTIPSTNLTLLYDNRRVYPGSTPELLKMWEKAKLIVCEHGTIRHLQRTQKAQTQEPNLAGGVEGERSRSPSVHSEVDDNTEKMKIVIRSASIEIAFRVKVTTSCGELVEKFLAKADIQTSGGCPKPVLQFDGDKLDEHTTLSELDIDDGDIFEISNLT